MAKNCIDKIWESHCIHSEEGAGDVLFLDLQLLHEVTSPQAFSELRKSGLSVFDASRNKATLDHSIPTDAKRENFVDEKNRIQLDTLRQNCEDFGVQLLDIDSGNQGIVHVMGPEMGFTQPGMTICCGDSHTSTHGAFGALAFGVGTTQIFHVLASSCLLLKKPKTMNVKFVGNPSAFFSAKDAILKLIAQIGVQGGTGYALEFTGEFVRHLTMEERMTMCNMSIECGARSGVVSPDETTFEWILNTKIVPEEKHAEAISHWKKFASDENAKYDAEVEVNIENAKPFVTWGTTPGQGIEIGKTIPLLEEMTESEKLLAEKSLAYTQLSAGQRLEGVEIQNVFVGSCTNARFSDLKIVAKILDGRKVAENVRMLIVPGSELVEKQAKEAGFDEIFTRAGADFRRPGCSMCLAMNGDFVPAGERCLSTSNRNFIGRQGVGSITHLCSPLVAAISAVTGKITNPEEFFSAS